MVSGMVMYCDTRTTTESFLQLSVLFNTKNCYFEIWMEDEGNQVCITYFAFAFLATRSGHNTLICLC
jgi:hypothetical protein